MTSSVAAEVEESYFRGGLWVAILVMGGWHIFATLPVVVKAMMTYGLVSSGLLIWSGYAVLGAVSAVAVLRGGWRRARLSWTVCVLLLAGVPANALTVPGGMFGHYFFALTSSGMFAFVALWRRGPADMIAFFAANAVLGIFALLLLHEISRVDVARFISDCFGSSIFGVGIYYGSKTLGATAARGAEADDAAARTRNARLAAEAVATARRARYETLRTTVVPLLEGLADGTLDLTRQEARQEVAVAVTRLRRYLVENDDVPDPLSHELRACADAAERRGVAVDLIAAAGTIPTLGVGVRRALVEPVIQVLAATSSRARITVIASESEVAVAIVADASLAAPISAGLGGEVSCDWEEGGGRLWVHARWARSSASPL